MTTPEPDRVGMAVRLAEAAWTMYRQQAGTQEEYVAMVAELDAALDAWEPVREYLIAQRIQQTQDARTVENEATAPADTEAPSWKHPPPSPSTTAPPTGATR